ncbi:MAG: LysR substrate-binding domain-containing protein [Pseudomonadota bacterium]
MSRRVPPLNPLYVFEAVTRLGSFTRAAEELNVTQSAVSRQIAALEGYLNVRLFHRERHGITLTPPGEAYKKEISPAFASIVCATERILNEERSQPLFLRLYPTFAVKWLIPRLPLFHAEHPNIEVRLNTTIAPVDFTRENLDLAIQLTTGDVKGCDSLLLFPDVIQPVCAPSLLKSESSPEQLDDLKDQRLLHSHYRKSDWKDWLTAMDRPELLSEGMTFPSSVLTYQAAAEGLGIAIGQMKLLEKDFNSGNLIPLFEPVERELGYYALWLKGREPDLKTRKFLSWLKRQISLQEGTTK